MARCLVPRPVYGRLARSIGVLQAIRRGGIGVARTFRNLDGTETTIELRNLKHPFHFLRIESHVNAVVQNMLREEYGRYTPAAPPRTIVDAGAFIGDVTCWFASRYPEATIIALEPNAENHHFASLNTRPYEQIQLFRMGLWNRKARLSVSGAEDASHVCEVSGGGAWEVEAIDIPSLMSQRGIERIDILKMDIEGAEEIVLSDCGDWIDRVGLLIVEPHSDRIEGVLQARLGEQGLRGSRYRSLLYFRRDF